MINEELKPMNLGQMLDKAFKISLSSMKKYLKHHILFFFCFVATFALLALVAVRLSLTPFFDSIPFEGDLLIVFFLLVMSLLLLLNPVFVLWFSIIVDMQLKTFLKERWLLRKSIILSAKKYLHSTLFIIFLLPTLTLNSINPQTFFQYNGPVTLLSILAACIFLLLTTVFVTALPATINENLSIIDGIKRGTKLAGYSFFSIFFTLLLFTLIAMGLTIIVNQYSQLHGYLPRSMRTDSVLFIINYIITPISLICSIIFYPFIYLFTAAFHTVIYFNQRIKYEEFGLEKMTEAFIAKDANLTEEGFLSND